MHEMSGDDGFDAFGIYVHKAKSIAIDERFKFNRALAAAGDNTEAAKAEVAFRLVLHEMIHQALHQRGVSRFGGHGVDFVEEATSIAAKLGVEPPILHNAHAWPDLLGVLARYNI